MTLAGYAVLGFTVVGLLCLLPLLNLSIPVGWWPTPGLTLRLRRGHDHDSRTWSGPGSSFREFGEFGGVDRFGVRVSGPRPVEDFRFFLGMRESTAPSR